MNVNSGSSVDVRSSAAELGQLNTLSVRTSAARKAYGYLNEAAGFTAQAGLDRMNASQSETAGMVGAAGTLLGGIGDAATNYGTYLNSKSTISGGDSWNEGFSGFNG